MIQLSIIVVTWNCRRYLSEFFRSFEHLTSDPSIEVIVVDNASSDGTPELIETEFPAIRLVRSEKNLGFAAGNNVGLNLSRGEFIALVNPDVKILPGCFEQMMELLRNRTDIGLLGPQMFGGDGLIHRSTMRFPTVWNYFCSALALDVLFPRCGLVNSYLTRDFAHNKTREVEVLNGWFWMTRRKALEQIGPLDEDFFMYGEDIDWCKRCADAGWKRVYVAGPASIHYGGGSSSNAPVRFYIEQQRAILQYFKKHHGIFELAGFVFSMLLYHIVRILGHGVRYLLPDSNRDKVHVKIKRSMACILWLLGLQPSSAGKN